MEYVRLVKDFTVSITRAFVGAIFFFWPRKYKDIQGDVVLITGGGKGIGRLVANEFAKRRPKQLILWGRHEETLSATAKAIQMKGVACDYMVCDVSNRDQVQFLANDVKRSYGGVDILVNNAGIVYGNSVVSSHPEDIEKTIEVNLLAQFWTVKEFLPAMLTRNHGHIVSVNSMLGLMGLGGAADYSASKFGAHGFIEALRMELARDGKDGIHVTSIHPYLVNTDMFEGIKPRFQSLFPPLDKHYVAWKIVNAVCINQDFCIIPRTMYLFNFLKQILPCETLLLLQKFMRLDRAMDTFHARKPSNRRSSSSSKRK